MRALSAVLTTICALAASQHAFAQAAPLSVCDIVDRSASDEVYVVRGRYFSDYHHFFQLRDDGCDRAIGLSLTSEISDKSMWEKFKSQTVYKLLDTRQNYVEVEVRGTIEGYRARNPLGEEFDSTYFNASDLTEVVINGEVVQ